MKKFLAFTLVLVLFLSFGSVAFAEERAVNPVAGQIVHPTGGGVDTSLPEPEPVGRYKLYNAKDELIGKVPATEVLKVDVSGAGTLKKEDGDTYMEYYNAMKSITDRKVKFLLWVDIPESYKTDDLAYMVFDFECPGKDVQATVNGASMEVVPIKGQKYYVKMADFGALMVTREK